VYRFALRPRWVFGHLLVLAAMVTMVLLGRWQLRVSDRKHFDIQNFGYAIQWWLFTLFAAAVWIKIMRDQAGVLVAQASEEPKPEPKAEEPVAYRRYVMPQAADGPTASTDSFHDDYNAYLAKLDEQKEST
jgi:hypothetical protein